MANADKETDRSVTSGNPTESAQPISQAEGDSETVITRLVDWLKEAPRRMTLETRLGIATVTLLVFTFGFLVYRRVELHHQKLMQLQPIVSRVASGTEVIADGTSAPSSTHAASDPGSHTPELTFGTLEEPPAAEILPTAVDSGNTESPFADDPQLPAFHPEPDLADTSPTGPLSEDSRLSEPTDEFHEPTDFAAEPGPLSQNAALSASTDDDATFLPFPGPGAEQDLASDHASEPVEQEPLPPSDYYGDRPVEIAAARGPEFDVEIGLAVADERTATEEWPSERPTVPDPELAAPGEPIELAMLDAPEVDLFTPDSPVASTSADDPFDSLEPQVVPEDPVADLPLRATPRAQPDETAGGPFSVAAGPIDEQPATVTGDDSEASFALEVVREGDNFSRISRRIYGTSRYFSALAEFNQHRIADPKRMRPGMKVLVPPKRVLEERFPDLSSSPVGGAVKQAGFIVRNDGTAVYHVVDGDTLSDISARFLGRSSRWIEIFRLNQQTLRDPNRLKTGTILELPDDAVEVNIAP